MFSPPGCAATSYLNLESSSFGKIVPKAGYPPVPVILTSAIMAFSEWLITYTIDDMNGLIRID
jgi:hypothetical protein